MKIIYHLWKVTGLEQHDELRRFVLLKRPTRPSQNSIRRFGFESMRPLPAKLSAQQKLRKFGRLS